MKSCYPRAAIAAALIAVLIALHASASPFTFMTLAGTPGQYGFTDGNGAGARFWEPNGIAVDAARNLYIADTSSNAIRKMTPDRTVTTIAGLSHNYGSADGPGATATFGNPLGVAVGLNGNLFVADTYNNTIRRIDVNGNVTTFAGAAGVVGSADGTALQARFFNPSSIAIDSAGNMFVADLGNHTIRRIDTSGNVTTIAGSPGLSGDADGVGASVRFNWPVSVAVDKEGGVYVGDSGNARVKRMWATSSGYRVVSLAGTGWGGYNDGPNGQFSGVQGIAVDGRGTVYVADTGNELIRTITPGGVVGTVGGQAQVQGSTDGVGPEARFHHPRGVAVTPDGDVYVTDTTNNTIRYASNTDSEAAYLNLALPQIGDHLMTVLSSTVIELKRISGKASPTSPVDGWDFIDATNTCTLASGDFTVTLNGAPVSVSFLGFKRRPIYAKLPVNANRHVLIESNIYLSITPAISQGLGPKPVVTVRSSRFPETFTGTWTPLNSPVIHVNQEGYLPAGPKVARVSYYMGTAGELTIPANTSFSVHDATTMSWVTGGILQASADKGWDLNYGTLPYQQVWKADFSSLATAGTYRLYVNQIGYSLPFTINDGVPMRFLRAMALGLYHQRCGHQVPPLSMNPLQVSRFTRGVCHMANAAIPLPASSFVRTWELIGGMNNNAITNPSHLYFAYNPSGPATISVSGGHHDAGDYSKYTINVAQLINSLVFAADSMPGGNLDNLGIPESGNNFPDLLDEAALEAAYLSKLQDPSDGGFYFIVYPQTRDYELDVTPDQGDAQAVWPKNTSATAAAVAALAQIASSPAFKARYPSVAATYLQQAQAGWNFLQAAKTAYPVTSTRPYGPYQKITFYGDAFQDRDEYAWAACEMYLATGQSTFHTELQATFGDPWDIAGTYYDQWAPLFEGFGRAARSYAFATQSGRVAQQGLTLDTGYLNKCRDRITTPHYFAHGPLANGGIATNWAGDDGFGTPLPLETKRLWNLGFSYFQSMERGAEIAAAYQLNNTASWRDMVFASLDYEAGCNPVNMSFLTGLGIRRPREIVCQWSLNDGRALPVTGIPVSNVTSDYGPVGDFYGGAQANGWRPVELINLAFPPDTVNPAQPSRYAIRDRWTDTYNVNAEFTAVRLAGEMIAACMLAAGTNAANEPWQSYPIATINDNIPHLGDLYVQVGQPVTFTFSSPYVSSATAKTVWETSDKEPGVGASHVYIPKTTGAKWVEVEAMAPNGRRVFGRKVFYAY